MISVRLGLGSLGLAVEQLPVRGRRKIVVALAVIHSDWITVSVTMISG
jgi:hypothetical protein